MKNRTRIQILLNVLKCSKSRISSDEQFLIQQNVVPSTYEHLLQSAYVAQKNTGKYFVYVSGKFGYGPT